MGTKHLRAIYILLTFDYELLSTQDSVLEAWTPEGSTALFQIVKIWNQLISLSKN